MIKASTFSLQNKLYLLQKRYKNKYHWSNIENRNFNRYKAIGHFDDFYASIFGDQLWRSLRLGLLSNNKYCAVVNNYSDARTIMKNLEDRGALNMRVVYDAHRKKMIMENKLSIEDESQETFIEMEQKIDKIIIEKAKRDKLSSIFGQYEQVHFDKDAKRFLEEDDPEPEPTIIHSGKLSLSEGLKDAHIDHMRIIHPKKSYSASTLYEFVPCTKIQGMDEWISESQHLDYYRKSLDFPINIESDEILQFPEHLNIYIYEKCNITSFPHPEPGPTGVLDYYLLDGGSVVPVLAMDLRKGDKVLDMCGAPGGKAMTAMQTLMPDEVLCNDLNENRANRIRSVADEFLYENSSSSKFTVSTMDARRLDKKNYYNKILVDVPCTNDRFSVWQDENNYFASNRTKERLLLPELQSELLFKALDLVPVGGTVVYCTCSLSPIQNDGVVQMSLKNIWNESNAEFIVKDLREAFKALNILYYLGTNVGMKYGILVLPHLTANFGPMYISKIERVK